MFGEYVEADRMKSKSLAGLALIYTLTNAFCVISPFFNYLVQSYHVIPDSPAHLLSTYDYDGVPVTAAVRLKSVTGLQFYPEKSGKIGLAIMSKFLSCEEDLD